MRRAAGSLLVFSPGLFHTRWRLTIVAFLTTAATIILLEPLSAVRSDDQPTFPTDAQVVIPIQPSASGVAPSATSLKGFGYAAERNEARWAIIRAALEKALDGDVVAGQGSLFGVDYGADQGYFALSLAELFHSRGRNDLKVAVAAVEKGGVGGSIWASRLTSASAKDAQRGGNVVRHVTVHDIFRRKAAVAREQLWRNTTEPAITLCAAEISLDVLENHAKRCQHRRGVDVQLFLSMLHWVNGVDGRRGLCSAVCSMARSSRITVLELPHPGARRTFGEKRYRKWYGRQRNVTRLLEECVARCPAVEFSESIRAVEIQVSLLGQTPWGRNLFREIHIVRNFGVRSSLPDSLVCLEAVVGNCERV
jgi:hypothetical protein